nr:MAG TPA: hypothetical protein [Caudoviricetes sp.]
MVIWAAINKNKAIYLTSSQKRKSSSDTFLGCFFFADCVFLEVFYEKL